MAKPLDILIVEDVPEDARAIEAQLREESLCFVTRRVETREDLVEELQRCLPDIILSDFTLPELDALEALRLSREIHPDIPFILVTGHTIEGVAVECINAGADDYILKASLRRLPSSILNTLKKRAALREKAQAEEALRRSEEQYRLIAENTRDLISLLDPSGRFLFASPSFWPCLGREPSQLIGADSFALVHPDDRGPLRQALEEARQTRAGRTAELRLKNQAGNWLTFEAAANWIFDIDPRAHRAVIVSRDISQRKQVEETLRELPRLILQAQEAERRRVARDLHDSVNQILASVKFRFQSVEERLKRSCPEEVEPTRKSRELLERAIQEVRLISRNLRPSELDDLGLIPALRSLIQEFMERTGLPLRFNPISVPLSKETELHIYRIVQEGLTNIEKHARASRVTLDFKRGEKTLVIRLADDGCGIKPRGPAAKRASRRGMGLVDMKERAAAMGGRFACASSKGTTLEIYVPQNWNETSLSRPFEKRRKEKEDQASVG